MVHAINLINVGGNPIFKLIETNDGYECFVILIAANSIGILDEFMGSDVLL